MLHASVFNEMYSVKEKVIAREIERGEGLRGKQTERRVEIG